MPFKFAAIKFFAASNSSWTDTPESITRPLRQKIQGERNEIETGQEADQWVTFTTYAEGPPEPPLYCRNRQKIKGRNISKGDHPPPLQLINTAQISLTRRRPSVWAVTLSAASRSRASWRSSALFPAEEGRGARRSKAA